MGISFRGGSYGEGVLNYGEGVFTYGARVLLMAEGSYILGVAVLIYWGKVFIQEVSSFMGVGSYLWRRGLIFWG